MDNFFAYITGKRRGKLAAMEARCEYSESHLGAALTEGTAARMALLAHVQRDNGCPPTGQYCRDWTKCGCYLEAEEEIKQIMLTRLPRTNAETY